MATCNDCLSLSVCYKHEHYGKETEEPCEDFKDKSRYVEVVRCKDCEYWQEKNSKGTQGVCLCGEKDMNYGGEFYPFANDFCSEGLAKI